MLEFERIDGNTYATIGTIVTVDYEYEKLYDSKGNEHTVKTGAKKIVNQIGVNECMVVKEFEEFNDIPGFEGLKLMIPEMLNYVLYYGTNDDAVLNYLNWRDRYLDWSFISYITWSRKEELELLGAEIYRMRAYDIKSNQLIKYLTNERSYFLFPMGHWSSNNVTHVLEVKGNSFFEHFWKKKDLVNYLLEERSSHYDNNANKKEERIKKSLRTCRTNLEAAAKLLYWRTKLNKVTTYQINTHYE